MVGRGRRGLFDYILTHTPAAEQQAGSLFVFVSILMRTRRQSGTGQQQCVGFDQQQHTGGGSSTNSRAPTNIHTYVKCIPNRPAAKRERARDTHRRKAASCTADKTIQPKVTEDEMMARKERWPFRGFVPFDCSQSRLYVHKGIYITRAADAFAFLTSTPGAAVVV